MQPFHIVFLSLALIAPGLSLPRTERIFNGELATVGQFPYAVGLIVHTGVVLTTQCAGSLVSANFVLTAAQCVNGAPSAFAILGGLQINNQNEAGQVRALCERFIVHPGYTTGSESFDVALAQLPNSVSFNNRIQPIRLPSRNQATSSFAGQQGTVLGWGRFGEGLSNSPDLRFSRSQVITNLACRLSLPTNTILDEQICTDGEGNSPCTGDNGGPLTVLGADGITNQVGVFSFVSVLGCESGRAAVYTRIGPFLNWIGQNSDVVIRDN